MIKIPPCSLSGKFLPETSTKSLITSLLLSCISGQKKRLPYKGLSDDATCAVFLLEELGSEIKIRDEEIEIFSPINTEDREIHLNLRDSEIVAETFIPILKTIYSDIYFDAAERLCEKDMSPLFSTLRKEGLSISGNHFPVRIKGKTATFEKDLFTLDKNPSSDPVYLSLFIASGAVLETEEEIPKPFLKLAVSENGKVQAKNKTFRVDFRECREFFTPLLLHAMRVEGKSAFVNLDKNTTLIKRTISFLSRFGVDYSYNGKVLEINSHSRVRAGFVNTWQDDKFAIAACLASNFSDGNTELDSEECIVRNYPNFFSDFEALGGKIIRL